MLPCNPWECGSGALLVILGGSFPRLRPLDAGDGATDAHLALPTMLQHKEARRHAPTRRTAHGLHSRGFLIGLGRDHLAWSLGLPLLWSQHEAAAQELEARSAKVE